MNKTASRSLQAGIILVLLGGFFLYENLIGQISLFRVIGKYFPILFLWIGAMKAWAYFRPDPARTAPRSLAPALLWFGLGLFLLLWTMGITHGVFRLIGTWWPLFLILMGAGKLVDALLPGRIVRLSGGEIVFLIFLIPTGLVCQQIATLDLSRFPVIPLGSKKFHVRDLLKNSYQQTSESVVPVGGAQAIAFSHSNGTVELVGAEGDQIEVRLDSKVYADSDEVAQKAGKAIRLTSENDGGLLRLSLPTPQDERTSAEVAVRLSVPAGIPIRIENSFGDISAVELKNPLDLSARNGAITVSGHQGDIQVTNRYSKVSLTDVTGKVVVRGNDAKLRLENIGGPVTAELRNGSIHLVEVRGDASFNAQYGTIEGENITGNVTVQATETHIWFQGVQGDLKVENSRQDVQVADLSGTLFLKTRACDIELERIKGLTQGEATGGGLRIEDSAGTKLTLEKCQATLVRLDGPVQVSTSTDTLTMEDVQGTVDVRNKNGNIVFRGLPANPATKVAAATERGDITFILNDFPGKWLFRFASTGGKLNSDFGQLASQPAAEGGTQAWQNFTGAPTQATLTATAAYGNVHVKRGEAAEEEQ